MSEAAYHILIEADGSRSVYGHMFGGWTVCSDLIWGEAAIRRSLVGLPQAPRLFSNIDSDGAAVIDVPNKRLLMFSFWDNFEVYELPVYLDWLRIAWPGWEAYWLYYGMFDVVRYLNYPSEEIIRWSYPHKCSPAPELNPERTAVPVTEANTLLTVRWPDGRVADYLSSEFPETFQCYGPATLDYLSRLETAKLPEQDTTLCESIWGTLLLDTATRRLDYSTSVYPEQFHIRDHARHHWEGWQIQRHFDDLFGHLLLTGRSPLPYLPNQAWVVQSLKKTLMQAPRDFSIFARIMNQYIPDTVAVHPLAETVGTATTPDLDEHTRRQWVDELSQAWEAQPRAFETCMMRRTDFAPLNPF